MIDLDTVMPGYLHYDFGDAIRTFTNTADEDEKNLQKVRMDVNRYEAFSRGFLKEIYPILKPEEKSLLAFSPLLMTFLIGLRFLTDYLQGDIYFNIQHPLHNLERAKNQFKLLESMEDQFGEMSSILKAIPPS